jgi:hypothetical protein
VNLALLGYLTAIVRLVQTVRPMVSCILPISAIVLITYFLSLALLSSVAILIFLVLTGPPLIVLGKVVAAAQEYF